MRYRLRVEAHMTENDYTGLGFHENITLELEGFREAADIFEALHTLLEKYKLKTPESLVHDQS